MPWSYWRCVAFAGLALAAMVVAAVILPSRLPAQIEIGDGRVTVIMTTRAVSVTAIRLPSAGAAASLPLAMPTEAPPAFVRSALSSIAGRSPDYQDSFDDPASGWETVARDLRLTGWEGGTTGYSQGEYFVVADPAHFVQGPGKVTCNGGTSALVPQFGDFALSVDGRFISGQSGSWQVAVRLWNDLAQGSGGYSVFVGTDGAVVLLRSDNRQVTNLATAYPSSLKPGVATNQLQIVASGAQFAVLVNGQIALSTIDPRMAAPAAKGGIRLQVCNSGASPLRAQWDNLRIWNLQGEQR